MTIVNIIRIIMPQEKNNINEIPAYSAFLLSLIFKNSLKKRKMKYLRRQRKKMRIVILLKRIVLFVIKSIN